MSYVYEGTVGSVALVVEYCWSSVDNCVKVVEMTAAGKYHRLNWMSKEAQVALLETLAAHYKVQLNAEEQSMYLWD